MREPGPSATVDNTSAAAAAASADKFNDVSNLVFEGGGMRGLAFAGAVREARKYVNFANIKRTVGTSAGAITALAVAMGMNDQEIQNALSNLNFIDFLDEEFVPDQLKIREQVVTAVRKGNAKSQGGLRAKFQALPKGDKKEVKKAVIRKVIAAAETARRLRKHGGIFAGEQAVKWLESSLIAANLPQEDGGPSYKANTMTFADLHRLAQDNPGRYKDLTVMAFNAERGTTETFDFEHTPNVIVSHAVRASMGIPGLWRPMQIMQMVNGEPHPYTTNTFTDGGITINFPWKVVADSGKHGKSLGFYLTTREEFNHFTNADTDKNTLPKRSVAKVVLGKIMLAKEQIVAALKQQVQQHFSDLQSDEFNNTIHINTDISLDDGTRVKVSAVDFELSDEAQNALIIEGRKAAKRLLAPKSGEPRHSFSTAAPAAAEADGEEPAAAPVPGGM